MSQVRISAALRAIVYERAAGRCEYCRFPQLAAFFPHEPDHVIATRHRGKTELSNLALACMECNRFKGPNIASVDPESQEIIPLFNPRKHRWLEHFRTDGGGRIIPLTRIGRATAALLNFSDPDREAARRKLAVARQYP
jgi:hypothetical protein